MSNIRHRGIEIHVDTTAMAELDIKGFQLSDQSLDRIARQLKQVPFSQTDRLADGLRIREIDGYDVIYIVSRHRLDVIVTIAGVRLPSATEPTERVLRKLNFLAMVRSALGL